MKTTRKIFGLVWAVCVGAACLLPVYAEDYSNTEEWYTKCKKPKKSEIDV